MKSLRESQTSYSIETSDLSFNKDYLYKGIPNFDSVNEVINKEEGIVNNFGSRGGYKITYVVYHHTVCDFDTTIKVFTKGNLSSAHYLIKYNGDIYHLVKDQYNAWHAGKGQFSENSLLNSENIAPNSLNQRSIGIEIVNNAREEFTLEQYTSLMRLSGFLKTKHNVPAKNFVMHSDWKPEKVDPSIYFDTEFCANHGFGLYPNIRNIDDLKVDSFISEVSGKLSSKLSPATIDEFKIEIALSYAINQYGYFIDITNINDKSLEESGDESSLKNLQNAVLRFIIKFHGQDIINDSHAKELWDQHCTVNAPAKAEIIKEELAEYCYNHCNKVEILTEILSMLELVGN
jgi:N-acetyl-anhydromuramyl-L-alanine amidase AmpD